MITSTLLYNILYCICILYSNVDVIMEQLWAAYANKTIISGANDHKSIIQQPEKMRTKKGTIHSGRLVE